MKQNNTTTLNLKTMKQTPNDYAEMLINQHIKTLITASNQHFNYHSTAIQCAINDVNNTIEALT